MPRFDQRMLNLFTAPAEFTSWQDEQMSWTDGCYLHVGLSDWPVFRLTGAEVPRMFNDVCVNNVERLEVGASMHLIMCGDRGRILGHGMLVREDEEQYRTHVHALHVEHALASGRYDVQVEDLTGQRFLFQLGGPRSLAVLEAVLGEDLHDVRFLRHRSATIDNADIEVAQREVHIFRLGMAGTLGYELHGAMADAEAIRDALLAAGEPFGIRALGALVYLNALHTESGFPNEHIHFPPAFRDDLDMQAFLQAGEMLSLATVDRAHTEIGTEVTVLWGDPDDAQRRVRATVARYPYLDLERNERIDVAGLPTPTGDRVAS